MFSIMCGVGFPGTYGTTDFLSRAQGHLSLWSYSPHYMLTYTDNMSLLERIWNVYVSFYDIVYRTIVYMPAQNKLARKHFGHLEGKSIFFSDSELRK